MCTPRAARRPFPRRHGQDIVPRRPHVGLQSRPPILVRLSLVLSLVQVCHGCRRSQGRRRPHVRRRSHELRRAQALRRFHGLQEAAAILPGGDPMGGGNPTRGGDRSGSGEPMRRRVCRGHRQSHERRRSKWPDTRGHRAHTHMHTCRPAIAATRWTSCTGSTGSTVGWPGAASAAPSPASTAAAAAVRGPLAFRMAAWAPCMRTPSPGQGSSSPWARPPASGTMARRSQR